MAGCTTRGSCCDPSESADLRRMQSSTRECGKEEAVAGTAEKIEIETNCFGPETFVTMEGGKLREIQYIDVGDRVLSRNEVTGELGCRKVLKTFLHEKAELTYLGYANPAGGEGFLMVTTAEHPFWVCG